MKNKFFSKIILNLFILSIILPLSTLFIWVFIERYVWPNIIPNKFSTRAFNNIVLQSHSLTNTFILSIIISLIVSSLCIIIAILSARAFVFYDFKGKNLISLLMLAPFLVPSTVFGMGVQIFFLKIGLGSSISGVIICHIIYSLPYANKLIEEGTRFLGKNLEEQARVLGCSNLKAFLLITLPNLSPVILSAFTMSYIISISQYFLTLLIGGGRIKTFSIVMVPFIQSGKRNFASIYALIFLIISILIFTIFDFLTKYMLRGNKIEYFK